MTCPPHDSSFPCTQGSGAEPRAQHRGSGERCRAPRSSSVCSQEQSRAPQEQSRAPGNSAGFRGTVQGSPGAMQGSGEQCRVPRSSAGLQGTVQGSQEQLGVFPGAVQSSGEQCRLPGAAQGSPGASRGSPEQLGVFPAGWGVPAGAAGQQSCSGSMECTSQAGSPRVLPLHSLHWAERTRGVRAPFSCSFTALLLPGTQGPCWASTERQGSAAGLFVALLGRKRRRARERSPGGGERTRTMSSQAGHCVQPPPAPASRPRPQTPKIAAGPRHARTPSPSGTQGPSWQENQEETA